MKDSEIYEWLTSISEQIKSSIEAEEKKQDSEAVPPIPTENLVHLTIEDQEAFDRALLRSGKITQDEEKQEGEK